MLANFKQQSSACMVIGAQYDVRSDPTSGRTHDTACWYVVVEEGNTAWRAHIPL